MSRRAFPLEGLQALYGDRPDVVARGLLNRPDATVTVTPEYVAVPLEEGRGLPAEEAYGKPSDHAHRTTEADVWREVRDRMVEAAPEWEAAIHAYRRRDVENVPDGMLPGLAALEARCVREVRASLPAERPKRTPKPPKMRSRWHGPSSLVVTRRRDGSYWCNGVEITAEDAEIIRTSPELFHDSEE